VVTFVWWTVAVTPVDRRDATALTAACARDLYRLYLWQAADGYRDSLALCLVDAALALRMNYCAVADVVDAYCRRRRQSGDDAFTDNVDALHHATNQLGDVDAAAGTAIRRVANVFSEFGVQNVGQLRRDRTSLHPIRQAWRAALGPGSTAAWSYAMRLAHVPDVPADRLIVGYVAEAIGVAPRRLAPTVATRLIAVAADGLGGNRMHLEHAIWRFQAGRSYREPDRVSTSFMGLAG
jgi:hypothetical protein